MVKLITCWKTIHYIYLFRRLPERETKTDIRCRSEFYFKLEADKGVYETNYFSSDDCKK